MEEAECNWKKFDWTWESYVANDSQNNAHPLPRSGRAV